MPFPGQVVAKEDVAGAQAPNLAVAGHHLALTRKADGDVGLRRFVGRHVCPRRAQRTQTWS